MTWDPNMKSSVNRLLFPLRDYVKLNRTSSPASGTYEYWSYYLFPMGNRSSKLCVSPDHPTIMGPEGSYHIHKRPPSDPVPNQFNSVNIFVSCLAVILFIYSFHVHIGISDSLFIWSVSIRIMRFSSQHKCCDSCSVLFRVWFHGSKLFSLSPGSHSVYGRGIEMIQAKRAYRHVTF
jgi:hypothetical protein